MLCFHSVPDAAPRNVTVINSGSQTIYLSWLPPPLDKLNGDITGYVVKIFGLREMDIGNVTSYSIGGLNASSSYSFSVAAKTRVGSGPFSEPVSIVTHHGGKFRKSFITFSYYFFVAESPAPVGVIAERISATQIRVSWPAAEKDAANVPILFYMVKYYPIRDDPRSRREESEFELIKTTTNLTINGLVPTQMYGVAVAINTEFGTGTFSDPIIVGCKLEYDILASALPMCNIFYTVSESSLFQLFFTGAIECQQWIVSCLLQ